MIKRVKLWRGVAVAFALVNVASAVYAAVLSEWPHAGLHVALTMVGAYAAWRLVGRGNDEQASPSAQGIESLPQPTQRLEQLQQSVDAVTLEVERIGEAQRFSAKLQAERVEPPR